MKLHSIRISNFQSFGAEPIELTLENITYLIGPNGSGKTAALGLCADCLHLIHHYAVFSAQTSMSRTMNKKRPKKGSYGLRRTSFSRVGG